MPLSFCVTRPDGNVLFSLHFNRRSLGPNLRYDPNPFLEYYTASRPGRVDGRWTAKFVRHYEPTKHKVRTRTGEWERWGAIDAEPPEPPTSRAKRPVHWSIA